MLNTIILRHDGDRVVTQRVERILRRALICITVRLTSARCIRVTFAADAARRRAMEPSAHGMLAKY